MRVGKRIDSWVASKPLRQQWWIFAISLWLGGGLVGSALYGGLIVLVGGVLDFPQYTWIMGFVAAFGAVTIAVWKERHDLIPEEGFSA